LMWGWQAGFLVCAGLALVCLAGLGAVQSNDPPAGTAVWGRLDRGVVRLAGYALFMGAGMTNVATYIVLYAHEQVGLGAQLAGWLLAVIGVAAVVARTGWSVLAERTGKSVHNWLLGTMAVSAVVATGLVALAQVAGPGLLWLAAAIAGLSGAAWNGVVMLLVILDAPPDRTAIASGQVQAAFFFGLCASPPIFGLLVDRFDSYPVGWAWTAACFAAAALIPGLLTRHDDP
jgi:MFS transporter, CP family, cyanate transporter